MQIIKAVSPCPVTVSRSTLVAVITLGLVTTLFSILITGSFSPKTKTTSVVVRLVDATTPGERQADKVNLSIGVLSLADAHLYRMIFAAQKRGDWAKADADIAKLADKGLMGHVLADRYLRGTPSLEELSVWLENYKDHPEADTIYKLAVKQIRGKKPPFNLTTPEIPATWGNGSDGDGTADFVALMPENSKLSNKKAGRVTKSINTALSHQDPDTARVVLTAAQTEQSIAGSLAAEAKGAIAAGYFYSGERDQARSYASDAAAAHQPLGLWIKGLIAWEQNDIATAAASFSLLSEHSSLNPSSRAAAHFWAYRALKQGNNANAKQAQSHLELAAKETRTFYGILASDLLGRSPIASAEKTGPIPTWNQEHRVLIASQPTGWRALALIQVGQTAMAESETRYLDPRKQEGLQQALLALSNHAPLPALALQLATLDGLRNDSNYNTAFYPVPAWEPDQGFQIDKALLFALARHESQFDPTAISASGAVGLMQIMPSTAGIMESDNKEAKDIKTNGKLFDPIYNLALGQKYVQHLADQPGIGDNLMLLLAAYNGGPNKIQRWLDAGKSRQAKNFKDDPLLFLESIPLRETRNHITCVLPHYWTYRARMDMSLASLKQLAEGAWPRFALTDESVVKQTVKQASATRVDSDGIRLAVVSEER